MSYVLASKIEAEAFDLERGFVSRSADYASGDRVVEHRDGAVASMSTSVDMPVGLYDIHVTYYDESDGKSRTSLSVDGKKVDDWVWDDGRASPHAGDSSQTTRVIRNVELGPDSDLLIEGARDGDELLRIDSLEIRPPSDRPGADAGAFEGAEGYGAVTDGGRGGFIVRVTNLEDDGAGSLRWALEDLDMPRIVIFDVGGVIDLEEEIEVNGDVTVAGQTAPGEGVTIEGARLKVVEDDVIIRGLHVRPGDGGGQEAENRDGISVGDDETKVERVVIDSNSITWSVDEAASVWSGASDVTWSNNIIAEALDRSIHPEGRHSMGMILGDKSERVTVVDNLFANNFHRNPQVIDASEIEFVNNLVSNWGDNGFEVAGGEGRVNTGHVIGNVFAAGKDTSDQPAVRFRDPTSSDAFYLEDNFGPGRNSSAQDEADVASGERAVRSRPVFEGSGVEAHSASEVIDRVVSRAGARPGDRDDVDARIISDVLDGVGRVIDSPREVGGGSTPTSRATPRDVDLDGIPDAFESRVGAKANVFDAHDDADGDGFTNIEEYINGLLDGFETSVKAPESEGPDEPAPAPTPAPAPKPTPKPDMAPIPSQNIHLEAEGLRLVEGFEINRNPHASGGRLIQAGDDGVQRAELDFSGPSGRYDLAIDYFDEADGASQLAVMVGDDIVDQWRWNEGGERDLAHSTNARRRVIEDVEIEADDTVALIGYGDDGEPLRIDALSFDSLF